MRGRDGGGEAAGEALESEFGGRVMKGKDVEDYEVRSSICGRIERDVGW